MDQSVHSRLASLESIHEDALHRLSSKLDQVERQLSVNRESEGLMTQIASRLQQVEPRLQSQADLCDRVASIESRLRGHSSDIPDRVLTLEANARPDPEQERILTRINAKLDILEEQQRNGRKVLGSKFESSQERRFEPPSRESVYDDRPSSHLGTNMEKHERTKYLQSRLEKLKALRSRYEESEGM
jgi:hypothetical protein